MRAQVDALPDCANVLYLSGMKFGSTGRPDLTWMQNTVAPALVARRYARSRIVAFSTGNVYPLVDVGVRGLRRVRSPRAGRRIRAVLPRPRARLRARRARARHARVLLFRLFYAVDLRYGTLADVARKVWAGEPVDVTVGHVNAIWQGDANSYALRCLELCDSPARAAQRHRPDAISVREAASFFARRFGREARIVGREGGPCLLGDAAPRGAPAGAARGLDAAAHGVVRGLGGEGRTVARQADEVREDRWAFLRPSSAGW